jgi:opacity protein-like surface antigen
MGGPATNSGGTQQAVVQQDYSLPAGPGLPLPSPTFTPVTPKSTQFATRAYLGYQFSRIAAFELGFQFYSTIKYDAKHVATLGDPTVRVRDVDLLFKGIIPFRDWFDVFAKAGIGYTYVTTGSAFNPSIQNTPANTTTGQPATSTIVTRNEYITKVSPIISIGADYNINQNWVADITYTNMQVGNKVNSVSNISIGFSYHFVDKYCGQFLCDD